MATEGNGSVGTTATYSCPSLFSFTGNETSVNDTKVITCMANGNWSTSFHNLSCLPVELCDRSLLPRVDGFTAVPTTINGTMGTVGCLVKYFYPNYTQFYACMDTGDWLSWREQDEGCKILIISICLCFRKPCFSAWKYLQTLHSICIKQHLASIDFIRNLAARLLAYSKAPVCLEKCIMFPFSRTISKKFLFDFLCPIYLI